MVIIEVICPSGVVLNLQFQTPLELQGLHNISYQTFTVHLITIPKFQLCWCTEEFQNRPKWKIIKFYLSGDKLKERITIYSPLCALRTGIKSSSQEPMHVFHLYL